jgi:hypothetical protein
MLGSAIASLSPDNVTIWVSLRVVQLRAPAPALLPGTEERVTDALDAMATSASTTTTTRVAHLAVVR